MRLMWFVPATVGSVAAARRDVAEALADLPDEVLDRVLLMVSELVTNAVVHAGSGCRLVLERTADDVRVEVHDQGPGEAELRAAGPTESTGRGLHIIDTLADQWAVIREPERDGKTVWFGVSLATGAAADQLPTISTSAPVDLVADLVADAEPRLDQPPAADGEAAPAGS